MKNIYILKGIDESRPGCEFFCGLYRDKEKAIKEMRERLSIHKEANFRVDEYTDEGELMKVACDKW